MSTARETALRALWGRDEFLDTTPLLARFRGTSRESLCGSHPLNSGGEQELSVLNRTDPMHGGRDSGIESPPRPDLCTTPRQASHGA